MSGRRDFNVQHPSCVVGVVLGTGRPHADVVAARRENEEERVLAGEWFRRGCSVTSGEHVDYKAQARLPGLGLPV